MARPIQGKEKRIKTTLTFDPAIKKLGEKISKSRRCSFSKLLEDLVAEEQQRLRNSDFHREKLDEIDYKINDSRMRIDSMREHYQQIILNKSANDEKIRRLQSELKDEEARLIEMENRRADLRLNLTQALFVDGSLKREIEQMPRPKPVSPSSPPYHPFR